MSHCLRAGGGGVGGKIFPMCPAVDRPNSGAFYPPPPSQQGVTIHPHSGPCSSCVVMFKENLSFFSYYLFIA